MKSNFWNKKNVVVTGASGFIGSHMVDQLVENGAVVTAVVSQNNQDKVSMNLSNSAKKIKLVPADLLNIDNCMRILKNQDIVLNFAALDGSRTFKAAHSAHIFTTNTGIVSNILETARKNNVERVLLISSIEIYRNDPEDGYIHSKKFSEIAARLYGKQYGMKIAIARPGNIYGPRDSTKEDGRVVPSFITRALKNDEINVWGNDSQKTAFLYVTDLVKALLDLTEYYPECDPVDIIGSNKKTILSLAEEIKDLTGSASKINFKQIAIKPTKQISNRKAKKIIKMKEYMTLTDGLKKTISYFKSVSDSN